MKNIFKQKYLAHKNLFAFCDYYSHFITLFYTMSDMMVRHQTSSTNLAQHKIEKQLLLLNVWKMSH